MFSSGGHSAAAAIAYIDLGVTGPSVTSILQGGRSCSDQNPFINYWRLEQLNPHMLGISKFKNLSLRFSSPQGHSTVTLLGGNLLFFLLPDPAIHAPDQLLRKQTQ